MSTVKYTRDHEWVKVEGNIATVGITDFAVQELGDLVYVELPVIGDEVRAGERLASVESVKAASDVFAPVSGEVVEVNEALEDEAGLLNESPMEEGWIARVEMNDPKELDALMDRAEYDEFVKEASH
ncbi:MAG: glycine cleavage system protein GcvH [Firmicutes bacterium]|jgi:glycine cleavage system H protein|nr:glycine cleavage system protein GcvH [Bacillota bacterium]